jgi:hypothetical protein
MASIRVPSRLPGAPAKMGGTGRAILTNFAILAAAFTAVTAGSRSEAAPTVSAGCAAFTGSSGGVGAKGLISPFLNGFAAGDTLVVTGTSTSLSPEGIYGVIYDETASTYYPTPAAAKATLNFKCNVRRLPNRLLANKLASKPIHLKSDVSQGEQLVRNVRGHRINCGRYLCGLR